VYRIRRYLQQKQHAFNHKCVDYVPELPIENTHSYLGQTAQNNSRGRKQPPLPPSPSSSTYISVPVYALGTYVYNPI
jgi:hypothetical protein